MTLQPNSQLYNKLCNPIPFAPSPASTLASGTGIAMHDQRNLVPLCQGSYGSCDSGDLLIGRVSEVHKPNTLDGCADGADSTAAYNESVKQIVVSAINNDVLRGGVMVKIQATVISYSKYDRVDYFFTSNATMADWKFITTVAPLEGESNVTAPSNSFPDITYTLPKCLSTSHCRQAVR